MALEGGAFLTRAHVPDLDRPSILPETRVLPSPLNATDKSIPVWPLRVARSCPVPTSQTLIVLS